VVLLIPLGAEVFTGVRPGLLLVPPVLLKLGSVGYRFVRYYTGDPRYRGAGPPEIVLRLIGIPLVLFTVALFGTGIELWLFGFRFGEQWLTWHKAAFVLWFLAMTVHVVAYWRRAPELAIAEARARLGGARWRADPWLSRACSSVPRWWSRCCPSHRRSRSRPAPADRSLTNLAPDLGPCKVFG
jgi:hypothetical protein